MKAAMICFIGTVGTCGHAEAGPMVEGQMRPTSGGPTPGAQVRLFDLANLCTAPVGAATDATGQMVGAGVYRYRLSGGGTRSPGPGG